ncbi:MAG: hypothetical protein JO301_03925 [Chitinophagaceae bacterium]|nr:hypothetical protein [Chitinophagaceae bacterium]
MKKPVSMLLALLMLTVAASFGQKITYSDPDREDARTLNFEIMGRMNGKVLVYKNYRDFHFISVYDADMKQVDRIKLEFLTGRILNTEFVQYPDFVYMIYQFQKKNTMYCMAAKLDANGKKVGEPIQLDTTEVSYASSNKIYSIINSDDKQKIMVFKINTRNDKAHALTTVLFDKDLTLIKKTRLNISMPQRNDFLTEFTLDNDGDLACVRASGTASNDNINKVSLVVKPARADNYSVTDLKFSGIFLDDIRIKADNINKHYVITSFFSKQRRGNIEGLYYSLWDKLNNKELMNATTVFSDEFREDAKAEGGLKAAFNDYFLKNVILRRDGGFIVVAESAYTSSRGNTLNRWDYLYGSPFWSPVDYYTWNSPTGYYPWYRSSLYNNSNVLTRYFADNVAVISFEPTGKMEWSNVIRKSQYDDNTDNFIGYGLLNMGDQLHFIFNIQEKRSLILSDQSIAPSGQIDRNPTFKNLDKGYDFMPRHAKQVGSRVAIVPCQYRGFTCFAKIEF